MNILNKLRSLGRPPALVGLRSNGKVSLYDGLSRQNAQVSAPPPVASTISRTCVFTKEQ